MKPLIVKGFRYVLELLLLALGIYMAAPGLVDAMELVQVGNLSDPAQAIQSLALVWLFTVASIVSIAAGLLILKNGKESIVQDSLHPLGNMLQGMMLTGCSALIMLHSETSFWFVMTWLLSWIAVGYIRPKKKTECDPDAAVTQAKADTESSNTPVGS